MLERGLQFTLRRSSIAKRRLITLSLRGFSDDQMEPEQSRLIAKDH
jgi:hypothetical protein